MKIMTLLALFCLTACERSFEQMIEEDTFLEPEYVNDLYTMLKDVTDLLDQHSIRYSLHAGSLLGSIRHKGIIPWDDDVDLIVLHEDEPKLVELKPELDKMGYHFVYDTQTAVMYDISKKENPLYDLNRKELTFPFIDIFIMHKDQKTDTYVYTNWKTRSIFKQEWIKSSEFFPLKKCPFGPLKLSCIQNPEAALDRFYNGPGWREKGIVAPRHFKPKHTHKFEINFKDYPQFLFPAK